MRGRVLNFLGPPLGSGPVPPISTLPSMPVEPGHRLGEGRRPENQPASQLGSACLRSGHRQGSWGPQVWYQCLGSSLGPMPVPHTFKVGAHLGLHIWNAHHLWRWPVSSSVNYEERFLLHTVLGLQGCPQAPAPPGTQACTSLPYHPCPRPRLILPLPSPLVSQIHPPSLGQGKQEKNNVASSLPACNLRQRLSSPSSAALTPLPPQLRALSTPRTAADITLLAFAAALVPPLPG